MVFSNNVANQNTTQLFKLTIEFIDGDRVVEEVLAENFQELTSILFSAFETTHSFMLNNSKLYATQHIKYIYLLIGKIDYFNIVNL